MRFLVMIALNLRTYEYVSIPLLPSPSQIFASQIVPDPSDSWPDLLTGTNRLYSMSDVCDTESYSQNQGVLANRQL